MMQTTIRLHPSIVIIRLDRAIHLSARTEASTWMARSRRAMTAERRPLA